VSLLNPSRIHPKTYSLQAIWPVENIDRGERLLLKKFANRRPFYLHEELDHDIRIIRKVSRTISGRFVLKESYALSHQIFLKAKINILKAWCQATKPQLSSLSQ
jgi:hypothetical protein